MHVAATLVDKAATRCINVWSAGWIVAIVCGDCAHRDHDQAGTGMCMPPAVTYARKRIPDDIAVGCSVGVNPGFPLARLHGYLDLIESDAGQRGAGNELRRHAHRWRRESWHDCEFDERRCDGQW